MPAWLLVFVTVVAVSVLLRVLLTRVRGHREESTAQVGAESPVAGPSVFAAEPPIGPPGRTQLRWGEDKLLSDKDEPKDDDDLWKPEDGEPSEGSLRPTLRYAREIAESGLEQRVKSAQAPVEAGALPPALPSKPSHEPPPSYEKEVAKLKWGLVVFNPPLRMTVAATERIETRITRSIPPDLYTGLKGPGDVQTEEARVGPHMMATLLGANFDIVTLNTAEQYVGLHTYGQWAWDVTPRRRGVQKLALRVTVRLRLPNHPDEMFDESVLEKEISVRVNALHSVNQLVLAQWRWVVGTVLSALVAAVLTALVLSPSPK